MGRALALLCLGAILVGCDKLPDLTPGTQTKADASSNDDAGKAVATNGEQPGPIQPVRGEPGAVNDAPPVTGDAPTVTADAGGATADAGAGTETTPTAEPDSGTKSAADEETEKARLAAIANAPHVYMQLQPERGRPTSVVFAIDQSRNETPSDDPAIRITPEDGKCNPQELRHFTFSTQAAAGPVFGPEQVRQGLSARELPNFLAASVTQAMLGAKLIETPEQSRAQNVCTRKLWEQLILNQSRG